MNLRELLHLGLLLGFSCLLVRIRVAWSDTIHYAFLVWNLFLAMIPLGISLLYARSRARFGGWGWLLLCLLAWLAFFPNAPYITTDLMHLGHHPYMPVWYDALMVLSCALTGMWAGFLSLHRFEAELWARIGLWPTHAFVAAVWFLTGIGIYLGRVLRWNSWDLLRRPGAVIAHVLAPFLHPSQHAHALAMILLYSAFFWLAYLLWRSHEGGGQGSGPQAWPSK